jgi:hypothetical protein
MENLSRAETRMMLVAMELLKDDYRKYAVGSPADLQSLHDVSNLQDKLIRHLEKLAY